MNPEPDTCHTCLQNQGQLDVLEDKVDRIVESMTRIEAMVQGVIVELKPTLDSLMANPMLRMLFPGGKK